MAELEREKKQSNTNSIGETAEGEIGEGTANDYSSQEATRQLEREEAARQEDNETKGGGAADVPNRRFSRLSSLTR